MTVLIIGVLIGLTVALLLLGRPPRQPEIDNSHLRALARLQTSKRR